MSRSLRPTRNITRFMKVSSDRCQKEERQTGPHRHIRCTRRDRGSSRWYQSAFTREKPFFISLFRIHLNNTTSCCECASHEKRTRYRCDPGCENSEIARELVLIVTRERMGFLANYLTQSWSKLVSKRCYSSSTNFSVRLNEKTNVKRTIFSSKDNQSF